VPAGTQAGVEVAGRIHDALKAPFVLESGTITIAASIGIARYPEDTTDLDVLVRYADVAMYEAKESGRATLRCYDVEMGTRARRKPSVTPAHNGGHCNGADSAPWSTANA
jgi:predicted signal transduction protein with EAL and GGDEF domain